MQDEEIVKGKWKEVKVEVQKTWIRLTKDKLENTKGDFGESWDLFIKYSDSNEKYKYKKRRILWKTWNQ